MRNLKKALVLVLTLAMMLSVMVVSTGATFTDQNQIDTKHQQAVDACVSLNIINGMSDGSFDPQGIVTREQMTKMICVLMNGGNEPVMGETSTPFTDVSPERWSAPYITSCVKQGIVAGVGDNKFNPTGNLTATQCAKMLLVALGYDQDIEQYTGPNWAVNVNVDASAKGFYKNLEDIDPNAGMTREHAAEMIWNALNADEVEYANTLTTDANGQLVSKTSVKERTDINNNKITLMEDKYSTKNYEDEILLSVKEDAKGTYTVKTLGNTTAGGKTVYTYTKYKEDVTNLLGQEVDVMQKTTGDKDVMGIYATDNNTIVLKSTAGQIDTYKPVDKTIKVEDVKYTIDNANIMYTTSVNTNAGNTAIAPGADIAGLVNKATTNTASDVYLVSNDGDSKIDIVVVIPAQGAKVTYVGGGSVTLNNSIGTLDAKDYTAYDGIAKNDWVVYTPESTSTHYTSLISKMEIVSGTIEATKGSAGDMDAKINGTYYSRGSDFSDTDPKSNDSVNAAVYAGCYYDLDAVSNPTASDILFVYAAGKMSGGTDAGLVEASVVLADGTKQSMIIDDIYRNGDSNGTKTKSSQIARITNAEAANYAAGTNGCVYVGAMYTYKKDGAKYDLYPITTVANDLGYDKSYGFTPKDFNGTSTWAYTESKGLVDGERVDDNAVIFVANTVTGPTTPGTTAITGTNAKSITGKELKAWGSNWGIEAQYLTLKSNGSPTVQVAAIYSDATSYASESSKYGIINSKPEVITIDGKRYESFQLWTGDSASQYVFESSSTTCSKGDVIAYELDGTVGDNIPLIDTIKKGSGNNFYQAAMLVATPNGSKWDVSLTNGSGVATTQSIYTVDSDTTVYFINDDVGVSGDKASIRDYGAIQSAISGVYVPNVIYRTDPPGSGYKLDLLMIDVRGNLGANAALSVKSTLASTISAIDLSAKTITLSGSSTTPSDIQNSLKNVLAISPDTGSLSKGAQVTVVATNGDSTVFKLI